MATGNCKSLPVFVGAEINAEFVVGSFSGSADSQLLWLLRVSLDLPFLGVGRDSQTTKMKKKMD